MHEQTITAANAPYMAKPQTTPCAFCHTPHTNAHPYCDKDYVIVLGSLEARRNMVLDCLALTDLTAKRRAFYEERLALVNAELAKIS